MLVGLALAPSAQAGDAEVRIKAAQSLDGPFSKQIFVDLDVGEKITAFYRVRSRGAERQEVRLGNTGDLDGYRVRWLSGKNDITDEVRMEDGFRFTSKAGTPRFFRTTIKRTATSDDETCIGTTVFQPMVFSELSTVAVNSLCSI